MRLATGRAQHGSTLVSDGVEAASIGRRLTAEAVFYLQPVGLVLPAIVLAALTGLVRTAGPDVPYATLSVGIAALCVFEVPGLILLRALHLDRGLSPLERLPRGFALSGLVVLPIAMVMLTLHLPGPVGLIALLGLTLAGFVWQALRGKPLERSDRWFSGPSEVFLLVALWTLAAVAVSIVGAPMWGEEEVEIPMIRRIVESASPAWDGLVARPHEVTTYLVTPHFFQIAFVKLLAGGEIVAVYAKLRFIYFFVGVAAVFSLARVVLATPRAACVASVVALTLVFVDPFDFTLRPEMNVLFPAARRSSIAISVFIPMALLFAFEAVQKGGARRIVAVALLQLLILLTHAVEGVHLLLMLACGPLLGTVGVLIHREWVHGVRSTLYARRAWLLLGGAMLVTAVYRVIHAHFAPDIEAYQNSMGSLGPLLDQLRQQPLEALFGAQTWPGQAFFVTATYEWPWPPLALILGAGAVPWCRAPMFIWVWTALFVVFLVHLVPVVMPLMVAVSAAETFLIYGVITLLSVLLMAGAIDVSVGGLQRLAGRLPAVVNGALVVVVAAAASKLVPGALEWLVQQAADRPWVIAGVALGALVVSGVPRSLLADTPSTRAGPRAATVVALLAAVAVIGPSAQASLTHIRLTKNVPLRESLMELTDRNWSLPDPFNWTAYYPTLPFGIHLLNDRLLRVNAHEEPFPATDPWEIAVWLRQVLPPESVLLYRQDRIYWLAVYLNQYLVHSGFPFSTDTAYFTVWRARFGDRDPFFGADPQPELESMFLDTYKADYIIVDPEYQSTTGQRLAGDPQRFELFAEYEGYSVYHVRRPLAAS